MFEFLAKLTDFPPRQTCLHGQSSGAPFMQPQAGLPTLIEQPLI